LNFTQCNLGKGVRLHLCETDKFKSITCKVFIQQDLDEKNAAATAIIPLLLRRGSQKFPSTLQIARELEYLYAAEFNSDVLKIGERQILEFACRLIDPSLLPNGERNIERGLRTFWDIASNPAGSDNSFVADFFVQEKNKLRQEITSLVNNKRAYAFARAMAEMCADEPFGIYKYGDEKSARSLENEKVHSHYRNLFENHPMDIFLVGSNLDVLANLFGQLVRSRKDLKSLKGPQSGGGGKPRTVEEAMDVNQAILVMGYRTNCNYLADNYYALLVGNGILGGFPHSKLFVNVREKASLAYYVDSNVEGTKGILTINAGLAAAKRQEAVAIIEKQVREIQQGQISPQELAQTKRALIAGITAMKDNPAALIDRNIIGVVNRDLRSIAEVTGAIEKVQKEDVVAAMNKITLDTTYLLRPRREGELNGTN